MSDDHYRCIYWSKIRIDDGPEQVATEIDSILTAARRNNRLLGITGALALDGGVFAQFLEGEVRAVEMVFEKIQRDERHGDVQVLSFGPTSERAFKLWPMAFLGQTPEEHERFADIGDETGASARLVEGQCLLDIVRTLASEQAARRG